MRLLQLSDDGIVPNNPVLPAILKGKAISPDEGYIRTRFRQNGWDGVWVWTVFDYHHYHPDAHEALIGLTGWADIQLGGARGEIIQITPGDLCLLPAGTGHCLVDASPNFKVIGAYPATNGTAEIRKATAENYSGTPERIARVPLPYACPVFGRGGALARIWGEPLN